MKNIWVGLFAVAFVCGFASEFTAAASEKEKVVHSFAGGVDGWYPEAGLTDVNGLLYGSTYG